MPGAMNQVPTVPALLSCLLPHTASNGRFCLQVPVYRRIPGIAECPCRALDARAWGQRMVHKEKLYGAVERENAAWLFLCPFLVPGVCRLRDYSSESCWWWDGVDL